MKNAKVTVGHEPGHEQVLMAREGQRLRVVREDDEWPGWIWCVAHNGIGSWVPEPYLAVDGEWAKLLVDYDATELTVRPGDLLTLLHEVNGWWWAATANENQGWVPALKLEEI